MTFLRALALGYKGLAHIVFSLSSGRFTCGFFPLSYVFPPSIYSSYSWKNLEIRKETDLV